MPPQSGSDWILRAMWRSYRAERYLGIIERAGGWACRDYHRSDHGFPGRPKRTSRPRSTWCVPLGFAAAFTLPYLSGPGTPAAQLDGQLPKAVVRNAMNA